MATQDKPGAKAAEPTTPIKSDDPAAATEAADAIESAEDSGLLKVSSDSTEQHLVFEANKRALDKVTEPEVLTEKNAEFLVLTDQRVTEFVGTHEGSQYTITAHGGFVPKAAVDTIVNQAATSGVALTRKAV